MAGVYGTAQPPGNGGGGSVEGRPQVRGRAPAAAYIFRGEAGGIYGFPRGMCRYMCELCVY